jgi:hypothetical protein
MIVSQIYVVDRIPERLAKAKEIGCIPIDFVRDHAPWIFVLTIDLMGSRKETLLTKS